MATTLELAEYYSGLLPLQFKKPKAKAHIEAIVTPVLADQLPAQILAAFNINPSFGPVAVGKQLDVIGKYAGVSRNARTFSGPVVLNDADYILLISMQIVLNFSASDLASVQTLLNQFFPNSIKVYDHQNMHIDYFFDSTFGSNTLAEVFVRQGMLPKPMGVQLGSLIYAPNALVTPFFGMGRYNLPAFGVSGLNRYTHYLTGTPWLRYSDALAP